MTDQPRSPGSRTAPRADEATVRRLLVEQAPAFADRPLVPGPTGWDNTHWLLGGDLAVRLPRRASAVGLVANELRCLRLVADGLPLPVPVPVHAGEPAGPWPWPWSVIPWFPGERSDLAYPPADAEEHAVALGEFLAALHQPAPPDAPHNPFRSIPLAARAQRTAEALQALEDRGTVDRDELATLRRAWQRGLDAVAPAGPATWIHADLHPGNQLVDRGVLTAIVDWGDVAAGDPAADLAAAWWTLPVRVHASFWEAYGGADDDARARAAGWATAIAAYLLKEGPAANDPALVAMGRRTVGRLAATA